MGIYSARLCREMYCLALIALIAWGSPAFAALGENVSSLQADQVHLKASVRTVPGQLYSVEEMLTPSGTTIRQFISPAGTIFAVSWQGSAPDLQQLLGSYFDQFVAYANSQPSRRGRGIHLDTGDLVIQTGGHMRYVMGRAYLRSQIPHGVSSDEIR